MLKKLLIFFIVVAIFFTSGCYVLRKKFVRKKKPRVEEPRVYIDFKDYPSKPSREAYINYYLFVRGWLEDLIEALRKGDSLKREKRAINEAIMNVEQMTVFYNEEGKERMYPFYNELLNIKKEIDKNPNTNEMIRNRLIQKIEHLKREFEKIFNLSDAKKWTD
jgi:uncharacterized protein YneF (UPF0154 family)